jgi:hypothetical protein
MPLETGVSNLSYADDSGIRAALVKGEAEHHVDYSPILAPKDSFSRGELYVTDNTINVTLQSTTYGYGGVIHNFRLLRTGHECHGLELCWRRQAVTGLSVGFYVRFPDWEGFMSIDTLEIKYNNKSYYRRTGEQLYLDFQLLKCKSPHQRTYSSHLINGDKHVYDRNASAVASDQWNIVEIPMSWSEEGKSLKWGDLPLQLDVSVTFKTLTNILITDYTTGTPACVISEIFLRPVVTYWPEKIFQEVTERAHNGIEYKILDSAYYNENFTASATTSAQTVSIKMNSFTQPLAAVYFLVRPTASVVVSTLGNTYDPFTFIVPSKWYLTESQQQITPTCYGTATAANTMSNYKQYDLLKNL